MQKIKTALLSYGMSGKVFHAPFIELHPGFDLVGCWERSKKLIQQDYPTVKSFESIESILNDESIDLVIVNTPVATHFEYAKKTLEAGKHAVVEKAFTTTVAEARELSALAKEKNLKLVVFQNRRWDSDFKTVQKVINDGLLGDLIEAEFHFDRYNPLLSPKVHKESVNDGSGILKDLGPHLIDQALCLFGLPEAVSGDIRYTRADSVVDDWVDLTLFYPDFRMRLKASFFVREAHPAFTVHGKLGSFLKSRGDVQEDDLKLGKKPNLQEWGRESESFKGLLHTEIKGEIVREQIPTLQGNYYDFFDGVCEAIANDKPIPVTAEDGVNVMRVIEAAIQSNTLKQRVDL